VLDRTFQAPSANCKWVADFTYIWTAEGWLYVAEVVDLFSRRVVGWSISATMTAQLVTDALMMAIWRRGKPSALLHHSDRGSQYTSEQFERLMADHRVTCSMSRSGNCWDNAAMAKLLLNAEDRADGTQNVSDQGSDQGRCVRLYRALLQPQAKALDAWLSQPCGVRKADVVSLGYCQPNRQQLTWREDISSIHSPHSQVDMGRIRANSWAMLAFRHNPNCS